MTRYKNTSSKKQPPDIGLYMECEEDDWNPAQADYYSKAKNDYDGFTKKLEEYMKQFKGELILDESDCFMFHINHSGPINASRQQSALSPQPFPSGGSSFLVVDPRVGLVVSSSASPELKPAIKTVARPTSGLPILPPITKPMTRRRALQPEPPPPAEVAPSRATRHPRMPVLPPVTAPVTRGSRTVAPPPMPGVRSSRDLEITVASDVVYTPTPTTESFYFARKGVKPWAPQLKPSEATAIGGLVVGTKLATKSPFLTVSDPSGADSKEVTINKGTGKTFPSLVVVARPHIHVKSTLLASAQTERANLDVQVKGVLMYSASKFTEWLIQQGLVRSQQKCRAHMKQGEPVAFKLGMYSDATKFPYSGGYAWISDCCPSVFVSVFYGSIFEGAPHLATVILKLLYHWACQTNVLNVIQWVKVDPIYVKNVYTLLRAVCCHAVHNKYGKIGGPKKKVEVGLISLGTATQDGALRQVRVEVLGVMETDTKLLRLRALEPGMDERNTKRRWMKALEPIKDWVDSDSCLLIDLTVEKDALVNLGFKNIQQAKSDADTVNKNIMEYLRRIVPKVFQTTLSLLNRSIIQQFLDELVWRERWGPIAAHAFNNLLADIKILTSQHSDEGLLAQLQATAADPFKLLKTAPLPPEQPSTEPTTRRGRKRTAEEPVIPTKASPQPPPKKQAKVYATKEKDRSKDRGSQLIEFWAPQPLEDIPAETQTFLSASDVSVQSYYFGTLLGDQTKVDCKPIEGLMVKCPVCRKNFSDCLKLTKHILLHLQTTPAIDSMRKIQQCDQCFLGLGSAVALRHHVRQVHNQPEDSKPLICQICDKLFANRVQFVYHMQRVHVAVELPYACGICCLRSSSYSFVINHIIQSHRGSPHLVCPHCLKTVCIYQGGEVLHSNVLFYVNHIQRHLRQPKSIECYRCRLTFVNKLVLQRHLETDHASFQLHKEIQPLDISAQTMMPQPGNIIKPMLIPETADTADETDSYTINTIVETYYDAEIYLECGECEGTLASSDHFSSDLSCNKCSYSTMCEEAMLDHVAAYHGSQRWSYGQLSNLAEPMFCLCGYLSLSGNNLAAHLVHCNKKTAYSKEPKTPGAKQKQSRSDKSRHKSAGEPNVLNMLGLKRKSPDHDKAEDRDQVTESLSRLFQFQSKDATSSGGSGEKGAVRTPKKDKDETKNKSADTASAGERLIAELEDMMESAEPPGDAPDFLSDLIAPLNP